MRRLLIALLLLVPLGALALEYTDVSDRYVDRAYFNLAERAGVSVLTNLGAIEGNPDGTFRPNQRLNRAEFLKIALLSADPDFAGEAKWCFPDVRDDEWFSPYVCYAKLHGIVQGYPDGKFHPDREVNYVEALKILVELYAFAYEENADGEWYLPYVQSAVQHNTGLPEISRYGTLLTRGQMARLAAAFRAEADGELDLYRRAERDEELLSSSLSSLALQSSFGSDVGSSSVSSAASSISSSFALPSVSHILLIGQKTPALADGTFASAEDVIVREVHLTLTKKITSFSALYLVDATGKELATLRLDATDTTKKKWEADIEASADVRIPKDTGTTFAITAKLRPWGQGGISGEMIQIDRLSLFVQETSGESSSEIVPETSHFPRIQTAQTLLDDIRNAGEIAGTLKAGTHKAVATFAFSGTLLPGTSILELMQLQFRVSALGVDFTNPTITLAGSSNAIGCSVSGEVITCPGLPIEARDASHGVRLALHGNVTRHLGDVPHTLQMTLDDPGTIDRLGAIWWSDGTTPFTWVELPNPIAKGTAWTVVP